MPEEQKNYRPTVSPLPGNSNKGKEVAKKPVIEKVTTSAVVQRKKPLGKRFFESFSGDDAQSVGQYLLFDVVVPATKSLVTDLVSTGIERLLYGDSRGRSRVSNGFRSNQTSYQKMYDRRDDRPNRRELSYKARAQHDFDEIVISDRGEAEGVLERLQDLVNMYDQATVSDLYAMIDITGSFTDDKWGWTDLRGSKVDGIREGYLLVLPRPIPLD